MPKRSPLTPYPPPTKPSYFPLERKNSRVKPVRKCLSTSCLWRVILDGSTCRRERKERSKTRPRWRNFVMVRMKISIVVAGWTRPPGRNLSGHGRQSDGSPPPVARCLPPRILPAEIKKRASTANQRSQRGGRFLASYARHLSDSKAVYGSISTKRILKMLSFVHCAIAAATTFPNFLST